MPQTVSNLDDASQPLTSKVLRFLVDDADNTDDCVAGSVAQASLDDIRDALGVNTPDPLDPGRKTLGMVGDLLVTYTSTERKICEAQPSDPAMPKCLDPIPLRCEKKIVLGETDATGMPVKVLGTDGNDRIVADSTLKRDYVATKGNNVIISGPRFDNIETGVGDDTIILTGN